MIKSIGNSESISSNFDNLLSNMNNKDSTYGVTEPDNKVEKQKNDEFIRTFDANKIETEITKLLEEDSLEAQFSTDKETERLILKIINKETEEVVRQYPSEVSLKIARMVSNMIDNNSVTDVRV